MCKRDLLRLRVNLTYIEDSSSLGASVASESTNTLGEGSRPQSIHRSWYFRPSGKTPAAIFCTAVTGSFVYTFVLTGDLCPFYIICNGLLGRVIQR
ncbi:hypothetical protein BDN72DRAFT_84946 [Pluteus cervinus]|uniref:Uncharacterized protein n=1 Tax=Pluteus cervinus TaxID=181527 RepID=A0ACD3APQ7_9AGAR|nr:hypothetical protein BDN72DRAFT_84946 [Pluteus cervinus]